MIKRLTTLLFLCGLLSGAASAQKWGIKTNLVSDATTTPNLGIELKLGRKTTLDIPFQYNPWTFSENKKIEHMLVQPEFRRWFCEPFTGHFLGVHAHYGTYDVGGFGPLRVIEENRFEGWLAGAGISYGYSFVLGDRWSLEATIGAGYVYFESDRYEKFKDGAFLKSTKLHYFGPTRLGLTLIFLIQ